METRKVWPWAGLPKSSFWVATGKLSEGCDKADAGAERCRGRGAGREGLKGCSCAGLAGWESKQWGS
jgi:hypothetical protein